MARVIRSPDAEADMLEIWSNIADDKPSAADRFLDSLEQRMELLSRHPKIGESRPDLGRRVRVFTVGNYVIFLLSFSGRSATGLK